MYKFFKKHIICTLATASMMFASCGEVEIPLCNSETHPHLAQVDVQTEWSISEEAFNHEKPDSMFILAYRVIDTWKCGYVSTTKPDENNGRYVFNNPVEENNTGNETENETPADNEENTTTEESSKAQPLMLKRGDYRFVSLNYSDNDNTFEYIGLKESEVEEAIKNKEVLIKYKSYKLNDENIDRFGNDWTDFNPYSEYVQSNVKSIYFDYSDIQEIMPGEDNTLLLRPRSVTQDIEIRFEVEREEVVVEKIMGEISGIAQSLNLLTHEADPSKTFKMLMMCEETENSGGEGSMNGKNTYSAKFSVTALTRNERPTHITGAGIMQLAIYTYTTDSNNNRKEKVLNVGINLYNTIDKYGRIIYGHGAPIVLDIESILTINRNKVLEMTEEGSNLDKWIIYDDIDIDL